MAALDEGRDDVEIELLPFVPNKHTLLVYCKFVELNTPLLVAFVSVFNPVELEAIFRQKKEILLKHGLGDFRRVIGQFTPSERTEYSFAALSYRILGTRWEQPVFAFRCISKFPKLNGKYLTPEKIILEKNK